MNISLNLGCEIAKLTPPLEIENIQSRKFRCLQDDEPQNQPKSFKSNERPRRVVAARAPQVQPLLHEVGPSALPGPVQGLDWWARTLQRDSDGDCADGFLEETRNILVDKAGGPRKHRGPVMLQSKAKAAVPPSDRPRLAAVDRGMVIIESSRNR